MKILLNGDDMKKKIFIILFILLIVFFIFKGYKNSEEIRIRIISNSDEKIDIEYKDNVVNYFKEKIVPQIKLNVTYLSQNTDYIEELFNEEFTKKIKVSFLRHKFYNKTYNDTILEDGIFNTLLIKIDNANGSNWWGSVFDGSICYESKDKVSFKWYFKKYFNG